MKRNHGVPLLILAGLFFCFFYRQFLFHEVFYCCDNILINVPAREFWISIIRQGAFPVWNPYILSGMPLLADINLAPLAPFNLFFFFAPLFDAVTWSMIAAAFLGMVGMYCVGILLGMKRDGSIVASILFAFSGTMVVYQGNAPMIWVAGFVPWVMSAWIYYVKKQTPTSLAMVAIVSTIQLISGHPQFTFYTWLMGMSYGLWFLPGTWWKKIRSMSLIAGLTGLLSAVQLIPFLELAFQSTRRTLGAEYADVGALPFISILRFIIPSIVGSVKDGTDWWQGGSVYGYVGIIGLLLAYIGSKIKPFGTFFSVLVITSLLLAFGDKGGIFWVARHSIPFIGQFRIPSHFLLVYTFGICVLAGIGISHLSLLVFPRVKRLFFGSVGVAVLIGSFLFFFSTTFAETIYSYGVANNFRMGKLNLLGITGISYIVEQVGINILLIGMELGVFSWVLFSERGKLYVKNFLILVVFLDLFLYARMGIVAVPSSVTDEWLRVVKENTQQVIGLNTHDYRFMIDPVVFASPTSRTYGVPWLSEETSWQAQTLRPNLATVYGVSMVEGYSSMIYKPYQDYFAVPAKDPTGVYIPEYPSEDTSLLGLKYILTGDVPITGQRLRLAEIPNARSIVRMEYADNTWERVPYVWNAAQEVTATVHATRSGNLVFAETQYPGWKAEVNGKPTPIIPYKNILQSIPLSSGTHTVRFYFDSLAIKIGLVLTGFGIVICLGLSTSKIWYKR